MMVNLADIVVFDPNTATLYGMSELALSMNGNAIQLTLPRRDGGDPFVPMISTADKPKRKRKTAYQRRYEKNFKAIEADYKLKNGNWKKNGFKRAVKEAHRLSKK